jgi:regulatory protein
LDRLVDAGLQDDRRFAEAFTTDAHRSRGLASIAVQDELRRRGVDRGLAAEAATETPEEEESRARAQAAKRARLLSSLPPDVRHRRLVGFLGRRGYPRELCERISADAWPDPGAQSQEESEEGGGPNFPLS